VPTAVQIYAVDPGAGAAGAGAAPHVEDAARPVVMACPHCGGALRLSGESERLVPCQFCKADVYLPDDLWRRLHPAKTVREWFVRFEGKTSFELTQEAHERAAAERARADREAELARTAAAEEEERETDAQVFALKQRAYTFVAVLWALGLAGIAWSWTASAIDVLEDAVQPVAYGLCGLWFVWALVTLAVAGSPVQRRTKYDGAMMFFITWFFAIYGFFMPFVGSLLAFVIAIKRLAGTLGGSTIKSGGSSRSYPSIQLTKRETWPLAFAYFALAFVWPAIVFSAAHASP
jgi:hypothetical protein